MPGRNLVRLSGAFTGRPSAPDHMIVVTARNGSV